MLQRKTNPGKGNTELQRTYHLGSSQEKSLGSAALRDFQRERAKLKQTTKQYLAQNYDLSPEGASSQLLPHLQKLYSRQDSQRDLRTPSFTQLPFIGHKLSPRQSRLRILGTNYPYICSLIRKVEVSSRQKSSKPRRLVATATA